MSNNYYIYFRYYFVIEIFKHQLIWIPYIFCIVTIITHLYEQRINSIGSIWDTKYYFNLIIFFNAFSYFESLVFITMVKLNYCQITY